jgi:hypothetical protein
MAGQQGTLFDGRFLGRYAGAIMSEPTTALVELVANCWDAYATRVEILWPEKATGTHFSILDNGVGMSPSELEVRWRTLDYDRLSNQGPMSVPPPDLAGSLPRVVYGRNGKGRHAAFLFSSPYHVRTWRDGLEATYLVSQGRTNPIEIVQEKTRKAPGHGTEISGVHIVESALSAADARSVLSTRYLSNPAFTVSVDGVLVTFGDIPRECLREFDLEVPGYGMAHVMVIDSQRADRTTRQHGIAYWVNRRLVGQAGWRMSDHERILDGRTEEARRFTFIVLADFLASSVRTDWSDFIPEDQVWLATQSAVQEAVLEVISDHTKEKRSKAKQSVRETHRAAVSALSVLSRDRWNKALEQIIEQCPNLTDTQVDQVMGLLANLENADSQYALLGKMHNLSPNELDDLHTIFERWTIATAKMALDEIEKRLRLIAEIKVKTEDSATDEVQELQPLFGQALWIFGPQYESIEYTSNRGMTTVIRTLFDGKQTGSLNRPDFVMTPDGSVGFYARPSFDEQFNEAGTDVLVIVELKRPGVCLGTEEKGQVWKYVKELMRKGYVTDRSSVYGYVLGDAIDPTETGETKQGERCWIRPMLYSTFVGQAEKRMLNLHKRLLEAPFMQAAIAELSPAAAEPLPDRQGSFLDRAAVNGDTSAIPQFFAVPSRQNPALAAGQTEN